MCAAAQRYMKGTFSATLEKVPQSGEHNPGLYLHIPFCRSKCDYCSFVSYPCAGEPPPEYIAALRQQAKMMAGDAWTRGRTFETLFVGGGTPTIYDSGKLAMLIEECLSGYAFVSRPEVTVETNPNTVNASNLGDLRAAGVNRLSIGVQSFSEALLKAIGRTHSAGEAKEAFQAARRAGFENINLDLIFGLPGQTIRDLESTLRAALALGPEHLALYELMLEEGSSLTRKVQQGEVVLPSDDEVADMALLAVDMLAATGYEHYEISNFSRPGLACRHNINYWENGAYLGLGAGAVSCLSGLRIKNVEDADRFVRLVNQGINPFLEGEFLGLEQRFRETVIMGLRMARGVSLSELWERFVLTPEDYYGPTLERLKAAGLVEVAGGFMRLTAAGFPLANQVLTALV